MIPITRDRGPGSLPRGFIKTAHRKKSRVLLEAQLKIANGLLAKHDFDSGVWKAAKEALLTESHQKCCYCEASVTSTGFGDVEHYRPKSVYWWLAYSYENYLASCALCNQSFKRDHFPLADQQKQLAAPQIAGTATPADLDVLEARLAPDPSDAVAVSTFAAAHAGETALLVNPYFEDPAKWFAWEADDLLREVRLAPAPGADAELRVVNAEQFYGLNRPQLMRDRYFQYQAYRFIADAIQTAGLEPTMIDRGRRLLDEMQLPERPFAGMIRYFAARDGLV